ncbi:MAG TPA: YdcF family protein [Acidimicrobiia bacterium]
MARVLRWRVVLSVGLVLVLTGFLYFTVTFVQVVLAARRDDARPSQAIVVLGAAQYDGRPSPVFQARLDHAADLYAEGIAPMIVVTGGKQEGDRFTEAASGAAYLHSRGVPDTAILRETTSRSSWESLAATANFLEEREITEVVLVSDPFHSLRIEAIADELGLDAVTSPTRTSPIRGIGEWGRFATEAMRVALGRIVGFGRLARHGDRVGRLVPGLGILAGPSGVV